MVAEPARGREVWHDAAAAAGQDHLGQGLGVTILTVGPRVTTASDQHC